MSEYVELLVNMKLNVKQLNINKQIKKQFVM